MTRALRTLLCALACAVLALSGCAGKNAVDQTQNSSFHFKSGTPLGKLYPKADRKTANDFTGTLLDGSHISLSSLRGKIVVLNFWATWCPPCRTETPQFDLLYRQIKAKGVAFVGIDTKDIKGNAQAFVKNNDITYPIVYDEQGETALRLGNLPAVSLPFTVLIDQQGRVAAVYILKLTDKDLQNAIDKLLAGQ